MDPTQSEFWVGVGVAALSEDRCANYLKLKRESEYNEMSYLDKRKKDQALGRYFKQFKKQKTHKE